MSTYLEQWKLKQKESVLPSRHHQVESNRSIFQSIDDLPLPPPPSEATLKSSNFSKKSNIDFPLPPPSEIISISHQNVNRPTNVQSSNLYANIGFQTGEGLYESIKFPNETSSPTLNQSTSPPSTSLYANISPRTSANPNLYKSQSTLNTKNSRNNQLDNLPPTAIYANLVPKKSTLLAKTNTVPIKNYLRVNRSSANKEEDEVDHLTDLLVKSMENSVEPDFFGMCNKCGEKVVGEGSGCTAMEMVYHIQCFTCHVCHKELRGKPFYAMENNPHCEECYLNTLEKCSICEKPILDRILRATGKPYHPNCFTCVVCKKCLDGIPFTVDATNQIHCIDDFHKKFAPRCSVCKEPIVPEPGKTETVRVVALDRSFHVSCYKCEDCDLLLSSEAEGKGCYPLDDHIFCRGCNAKRVQEISAN